MPNHSLFSVMGIEIEYMLVFQDSLNVAPYCDRLLQSLAGKQVNEVEMGETALSNELVMHVIELKNNGPKALASPVHQHFQDSLQALQPLLKEHRLQLLPTGAHPWMDPLSETIRWPHGNQSIYRQYDKIFNCNGHGWANLQSMHVNLPFANDEEFYQLHNTIRLLLPLLPALAASTPILDARPTGIMDSRLEFYGKNQQRIPSISGSVIPEYIHSPAHYQDIILQPMYEDIKPHDPENILQYEWLNSRAAIAKFDMMAIEIRILDSQECVNADLAIARAIFIILKDWHEQGVWDRKKPCETYRLKVLYEQAIKQGLSVLVEDSELLTHWRLPKRTMSIRDVWAMLLEQAGPRLDRVSQTILEQILSQGSLSERIMRACKKDYSRQNLSGVYRQLSHCLLTNQPFSPS